MLFIVTGCSHKTFEYLTLDEAAKWLKVPEAVAEFVGDLGPSPELPPAFRAPYRPIGPIKLFDNLYFIGTTAVGSFIIDSGDGLVMLDTGNGEEDVAMMAGDMKKLGLDPSKIKAIFVSHEHFDHYGGVQYLRKNICPEAKVVMSLVGWNMLQAAPMEWAYIGTRPESVDIYVIDGMKLKIGDVIIQVVATPGHSPGCLSFIFPVSDNGEPHMAGVMGGSAVWPSQVEARQYKASVEYFKAFASRAGCDVGLYFHSQERDFTALRKRKPGEPNPLVIGTDKFNSVYLNSFRERYRRVIDAGEIKPPQI